MNRYLRTTVTGELLEVFDLLHKIREEIGTLTSICDELESILVEDFIGQCDDDADDVGSVIALPDLRDCAAGSVTGDKVHLPFAQFPTDRALNNTDHSSSSHVDFVAGWKVSIINPNTFQSLCSNMGLASTILRHAKRYVSRAKRRWG